MITICEKEWMNGIPENKKGKESGVKTNYEKNRKERKGYLSIYLLILKETP